MESIFEKKFSFKSHGAANSCCVRQYGNVRLSVLAGRILRAEFSPTMNFEDKPTQKVWYRDFEKTKCTFEKKGGKVFIKTPHCEFCYDLMLKKMSYVILSDGRKVTNFNSGNLKGTYRTLDATVGAIPLGDGLISRSGVTAFDDSDSLVLEEDGTISRRAHWERDIYYFAYGNDYRGCIYDFYRLTGKTPLVPRWCLGNWWSRYKAYTQQEYLDLMQRFVDEEIPITVATVDMDWHWVDVVGKFGESAKNKVPPKTIQELYVSDGWTGYSWNTDLFPDYKKFLSDLKDMNFKITLNIHPSTGVRWFEDAYDEMADELGYDKSKKEQIPFDITDKKFVEAYFKYLHHPYEKDGVDFWWIDWQQGKNTRLKGLDPLWALNHYHYLDNTDKNKRGLILSRYAEEGSHRYPLGFSGDTNVSWDCLRFQPYFTATAANVGYSWWSHDIGGHHRCKKDDELYIRWVQFGVFSPIMRLHSTSNEFMGKEPWKYRYDARVIATENLRLRHRLIPYIYTMNYRTYSKGTALCEPMYYSYPEREEAYSVRNEYFFGSELIAAPITNPVSPVTNLSCAKVWLPEGRFTDIFTGRIYKGGRYYDMYRGLESIPVLAKEGAIIPMGTEDRVNNWKNPEKLDILVYRGNGSFNLYEDDGETKSFEKGGFAQTKLTVRENDCETVFNWNAADGDASSLPENRQVKVNFRDIADAEKVTVNGAEVSFTYEKNNMGISVTVCDVTPESSFEIKVMGVKALENRNITEELIELITKFQAPVAWKADKFTEFVKNPGKNIPCSGDYKGPIEEILKIHGIL